MSSSSAVVVLVAGLALLLVWRGLSKLGFGSWTVLRATTGRRRGPRERDMPLIARWHQFLGGDPNAQVDDRTWDDLGMDDVFAAVDLTESKIGQQRLYARLRRPLESAAGSDALEARIAGLAGDEGTASALRRVLARLDDPRALQIVAFFEDLGRRPALWWVCPLLTLAALACLVGMAFEPRLVLGLVGLGVVNVLVGIAFAPRLDPLSGALHMLPPFIGAGHALARVDASLTGVAPGALQRDVASLNRLRLLSRWLAIAPGQANEPMATIYAYGNLLLLLDVTAFVLAAGEIRARRDALRRIYEALGAIDVALSIAAWRVTRAQWCRPRCATTPKTMTLDGIVHPLLDAPVGNDLHVDGHSVLITGSNMSGKTTFIRTVAVNTLLAQSLNTALAAWFEVPGLSVRSSIGRSDDLMSGKSYYLAEVESIARLIAASTSGRPHLFVIDEICRGTNTVERVAAARAILAWLDQGPHIVLVATHDVELLDLLAGRYEPHHFREQVSDGELRFDYRMRPGASSTRNAIALLELMRFPQPLVAEALSTAAELDARRR